MFWLMMLAAEIEEVTNTPWKALVVGAVAGIIAAGAAGYSAVRKLKSEITSIEAGTEATRADAAQTIVNAARTLVEPLVERVDELAERVDMLEDHIDVLEALMREQGIQPPERPR